MCKNGACKPKDQPCDNLLACPETEPFRCINSECVSDPSKCVVTLFCDADKVISYILFIKKMILNAPEKYDRVVSALSYYGTEIEQFYWWGDKTRISRDYCKNIRISINDILKDKIIAKSSMKNLSELHQYDLFESGVIS